MRAVRPLLHAVAAAGVEPVALLRAARLDSTWELAPDARLPLAKVFELFELALAFTRDPAFGLHSVEKLTTDAVSPLGALVAHAASLGEALHSLSRFRRLFGDEPSFQIWPDGGKVQVRCHRHDEASVSARRYLTEVAVGGLYLFLRRFAVRIDYVAFEYPSPEYHTEYARVFDGKARFNQPYSGLCFDAACLATPAPHGDPALHEALTEYAGRRIRRLTNSPWAERVHDLLVWQPRPRDMRMVATARKLGVSVRSLRRYLAQEGQSYPELIRDAQTSIAKGCLLDEHLTIVDTAQELGFADNTSFHRAFKRWTGLTPAEYRKAQAVATSDASKCAASRAGGEQVNSVVDFTRGLA